MPVALTKTPLTRAGVDLVAIDVAADVTGNTIVNDGRTAFYVANGSGSSITVTLDIVQTIDGQSVADRTVAIPAGEARIIGPFPSAPYNSADKLVTITFSSVTTVTVAAITLTQES